MGRGRGRRHFDALLTHKNNDSPQDVPTCCRCLSHCRCRCLSRSVTAAAPHSLSLCFHGLADIAPLLLLPVYLACQLQQPLLIDAAAVATVVVAVDVDANCDAEHISEQICVQPKVFMNEIICERAEKQTKEQRLRLRQRQRGSLAKPKAERNAETRRLRARSVNFVLVQEPTASPAARQPQPQQQQQRQQKALLLGSEAFCVWGASFRLHSLDASVGQRWLLEFFLFRSPPSNCTVALQLYSATVPLQL